MSQGGDQRVPGTTSVSQGVTSVSRGAASVSRGAASGPRGAASGRSIATVTPTNASTLRTWVPPSVDGEVKLDVDGEQELREAKPFASFVSAA